MTIPVVCPHCEAVFQLSPDLAGKSMRCPNADCREIFTVTAAAPPPVEDLVEDMIEVTDDGPATVATSTAVIVPEVGEPTSLMDAPKTGGVEDLLEVIDDGESAPAAKPLTGGVEDFLEVIDEGPAEPAPVAIPSPRFTEVVDAEAAASVVSMPAARVPAARLVPTAAPLLKATLLPGPKEVVWSGDPAPAPVSDDDAPTTVNSSRRSRDDDEDEDDDDPLARRRAKRRGVLPKILLFGVIFSIFLTGIGAAVFYSQKQSLDREKEIEQAELAYKDGNFPVAIEKFTGLIDADPNDKDAEKFRFFRAMAEAKSAVGSVTARDNYGPATKAFEKFIADYGNHPLAQPDTGYGSDVVQCGQRLIETVADHGGDRLKAFRGDRKKGEELLKLETSIGDGKKLFPMIEKYRDKEGPSLDPQKKRFDELKAGLDGERHRLAVLAPFRTLSDDPTAEKIEQFETVLRDENLSGDAEAREMVATAERRLRELIGFVRKPALAGKAPADANPPILFSSPVSNGPEPRVAADAVPDVVFAQARGVLYALDAHTGVLLWGTRTTPPTADPRASDLPVRVAAGDGDWVIIAGEWLGRPTLTARVARTGEAVWHQTLSAPAVGRPLVVGGRVYLPLKDKLGTVDEYELGTGTRTGQIAVRQPIGGGLAVLPGNKPGLSYLFVPAESRRVFIFEIGREDENGVAQTPQCVRVMMTEHPRDSLRGEPLLVMSNDEAGPRFFILSQSDGPTTMKLRAFPLPPTDTLAVAGGPVEQPTAKPAEVPVPGWSWFPAITDGERIVLATDAGAFLAFGVNQVGNADRPLFTVPGPKPSTDQDAVARSQIVSVEEDSYWAVLGGQLIRLRTAVDPAGGLRIVPQGVGKVIGEPVHRAQLRPQIGLGVVVVRTGAAGSVQAVGFDLASGQLRWQRRLGVVPAGPAIARGNGSAVVADEDGGVYAITPRKPDSAVASASVVASVLATPFNDLTSKSMVAATADGAGIWVLSPEVDRTGRKVRIRGVIDGVVKADVVVPLPEAFAGAPLAHGDSVLLPLTNGYLYRFSPGDTQLAIGPLWKGDLSGNDITCYLTPLDGADFLATDGGRKFLRWTWPSGAGAKVEKTAGPWELREKIAFAPVVVKAEGGMKLLAAEISGVVLLLDAEKPADPIRRWRGNDKGPIPNGPPTDRFVRGTVGGKTRVLYTVDRRHLVALDPELAEPAWVAESLVAGDQGELAGWVLAPNRVILTDQSGRVLVLNSATGEKVVVLPPPPGGTVAVGPAVPISATEAFLLLADGSGSIVPLPPVADAEPATGKK